VQGAAGITTGVVQAGVQAGGLPQVSWGATGKAASHLVGLAALVVMGTTGRMSGLKGEVQGLCRMGGGVGWGGGGGGAAHSTFNQAVADRQSNGGSSSRCLCCIL
jgi:hypothetical protein